MGESGVFGARRRRFLTILPKSEKSFKKVSAMASQIGTYFITGSYAVISIRCQSKRPPSPTENTPGLPQGRKSTSSTLWLSGNAAEVRHVFPERIWIREGNVPGVSSSHERDCSMASQTLTETEWISGRRARARLRVTVSCALQTRRAGPDQDPGAAGRDRQVRSRRCGSTRNGAREGRVSAEKAAGEVSGKASPAARFSSSTGTRSQHSNGTTPTR